jgi:acyl carrier protein
MSDLNEIKKAIREFLASQLGSDANVDQLTDFAPLISSRIVDSIIALKLVNHLEEKFHIEFEAHEVDQDNLDTIDSIAAFVQSKLK